MAKKNALGFLLFLLSFSLFAEGFKLSGGVGFSYMNHYALSKYKIDSAFTKMLEAELGVLGKGEAIIENASSKKMYNSMMVGLDLKFGRDFTYNEFGGYVSINVGFPFTVSIQTPSPMDIILHASSLTKLNSSIITDTQAGLYINLFSNSSVQLYIGTGVAFNWAKTQRDLPITALSHIKKSDGTPIDTSLIDSISEVSVIKMLGLGADIGLTCYFSDSIGVFFSVHNSFYFYDLGSDLNLMGKLKSGNTFTYKIAKDGKLGNSDTTSFGQNALSNNFGIKTGFSFRI
ncbi:MAG: hypothetical protein ACTTKH_01935 [Treponema sp.]